MTVMDDQSLSNLIFLCNNLWRNENELTMDKTANIMAPVWSGQPQHNFLNSKDMAIVSISCRLCCPFATNVRYKKRITLWTQQRSSRIGWNSVCHCAVLLVPDQEDIALKDQAALSFSSSSSSCKWPKIRGLCLPASRRWYQLEAGFLILII